jgi:CheY-like chemotaxis protein
MHGTTHSARRRARAGDDPSSQTHAPEGGTVDSPARVIIVEDESITALHIARQLRRLGYEVVALASSGPQAIEHALSRHPHVVLMDIQLQGTMDGVDAARHIQASAPIPIVYMSANADATTVQRIQATRPAGFVPKPINYPTLHALLQRVLSGR